MPKTAILLINLGTPDDLSLTSIKRYLDEFLMDPYVIDLPWILRALLVKGVILRFRPKNTQEAYKQIWTDQGSPLFINSLKLKNHLHSCLKQDAIVELGMRYGKPSIEEALNRIIETDIQQLYVLPLFPQYSQAATESAIQAFNRAYKKSKKNIPSIITLRDFYDHPAFIDAQVKIINQHLANTPFDLLLMSYHGLPVKHLEKTGCEHVNNHCNDHKPCPPITSANRDCYRAQCYATSHLIAHKLGLTKDQYSIAFQSRLGKTPWIRPYTDLHLKELRDRGISNLAITCPSFVADCLETLEEIGIRGREQWQALGGNSFNLIPCLNENFQCASLFDLLT